MSEDLFFRAAKEGWRYVSGAGLLTTEHLFELPLTAKGENPSLDQVAKNLHDKLQGTAVSFVSESPTDKLSAVQLELVKLVIAHKQDLAKKASDEASRAALRQKALKLLELRETQSLETLSTEELQALAKV